MNNPNPAPAIKHDWLVEADKEGEAFPLVYWPTDLTEAEIQLMAANLKAAGYRVEYRRVDRPLVSLHQGDYCTQIRTQDITPGLTPSELVLLTIAAAIVMTVLYAH